MTAGKQPLACLALLAVAFASGCNADQVAQPHVVAQHVQAEEPDVAVHLRDGVVKPIVVQLTYEPGRVCPRVVPGNKVHVVGLSSTGHSAIQDVTLLAMDALDFYVGEFSITVALTPIQINEYLEMQKKGMKFIIMYAPKTPTKP